MSIIEHLLFSSPNYFLSHCQNNPVKGRLETQEAERPGFEFRLCPLSADDFGELLIYKAVIKTPLQGWYASPQNHTVYRYPAYSKCSINSN